MQARHPLAKLISPAGTCAAWVVEALFVNLPTIAGAAPYVHAPQARDPCIHAPFVYVAYVSAPHAQVAHLHAPPVGLLHVSAPRVHASWGHYPYGLNGWHLRISR